MAALTSACIAEVGEGDPDLTEGAIEGDVFDYDNMQLQLTSNLDFDSMNTRDFNNDGINDKVRCQNPQNGPVLRIYSGADNSLIHSWDGSPTTRIGRIPGANVGGTEPRALAGCEVIKLNYNKSAVVVALHWQITMDDDTPWVAASSQYVVYNKNGTWQHAPIRVDGQNYTASARSVQCAPFPERLAPRYRGGALCFFAAYAHLGYTHTALLKLELNRNRNLIARDLTASSELGPWTGGVEGTHRDSLPRVRTCGNARKRDGVTMMDGTFVDYSGDGLIDLVTVGQHASLRAHRMVLDDSRAQGIRFENSTVVQAANGVLTEFLSVTALNKQDARMSSDCVYVGHEDSCTNPTDYLLCYSPSGVWERKDFPIRFTSVPNYRVVTRYAGDKAVIQTNKLIGGDVEHIYFRIPIH